MLKIIHRIKIKMFIDHINRKTIINRHRLAIINLLINFDRNIKINNVNFIKIKILISIIANITFSMRTTKNHLNKKSIIKLTITNFKKSKKFRFFISKISLNRKMIMINSKRLTSKKKFNQFNYSITFFIKISKVDKLKRVCQQCENKFYFNNKLHKHVRSQHNKKNNKFKSIKLIEIALAIVDDSSIIQFTIAIFQQSSNYAFKA